MKILIGYDGSHSALQALRDLTRAGMPGSAEALVVTVAELWPETIVQSAGSAIERHPVNTAQAREFAADAIVELRRLFPDWTIDVVTSYGSASGELLLKAHDWRPDLIVVGSHGRSRWRNPSLGSVSQQIVVGAPCSVRVSRGDARDRDFPVRLLIGVDGSANADLAVREVASRSWPANTRAWLVTSVGYTFDEEALRRSHEEAHEMHERLGRLLHDVGVSTTSLIDAVDPKRLLVEQAEELEVDCIVVGARGHSKYERTLLGSVSASVAARASCSVEVIRERPR